jgi:hypothetical protein
VTITIFPTPAPSGAFTNDDIAAARHLFYQPIYNVDYPHQDIFPWLWKPSYVACLEACDKHNAAGDRTALTRCEAALWAPDRLRGKNNCYLKHTLSYPSSVNVTLLGGIKLNINVTVVTAALPNGKNSTYCTTYTASASAKTSSKTHTSSRITPSSFSTQSTRDHNTSSSSETSDGRPAISFSPTSATITINDRPFPPDNPSSQQPSSSTGESGGSRRPLVDEPPRLPTEEPVAGPNKPTVSAELSMPSVSAATELSIPWSIDTDVLTVPTSDHNHRV